MLKYTRAHQLFSFAEHFKTLGYCSLESVQAQIEGEVSTPLHFIVFRRTGVSIYSKSFAPGENGKEIQETLFSGLLSGLMAFADETIGGQIRTLQLEDKRVILEGTNSDTVFCLVATRDDTDIQRLLSDIKIRFRLRFGEFDHIGFEFDVQMLDSFGKELDRIVERWKREVA